MRAHERPPLERVTQDIADHWLVLFGASGPIAPVVAILTLWLTRRDTAKTQA